MSDVASLAVGLHLNAANFKSQLMGAYGDAENSSKRFNRNAQQDAKKTDEAYANMGKTITGVAGRLLGFAGAGLSLGAIITTTRQYGQALSDLSAIPGVTGTQLKTLDEAAQEMGLVLRYVARFDANGKARVGVEAVRPEHPLASLLPCDNVFAIESRWYRDNPLVIRGPGAGRDVTAGAIQSDLNRLAQLL